MIRFNSQATSAIAMLAASLDARMDGSAVDKQAKLDAFAADFTRRLDAADAEPAPKPVKEVKPAASESTADEETETEEHQAVDQEVADAEEAAKKGRTPAAEVDEDEETDPDDPGEEEETEPGTDDEEEEEELDGDFRRAAGRASLPLTLDDIPEEARPLVKKRLKEVEAGFTRAMMDARSYRAEEKFRKEHPVDFIAEMLAADPDLEARVSAELEKRADETYAESRKIITDDRRKKAAESVDTERTSEAAREARITEVESLTQRACSKFGVPMRVVEAAIANAIITAENGDIDNGDITEIVKGIAKELGAVSRKERIEDGKERVLGKVRDRKEGLKIKPGTGRGAPPAKPGNAKKTLEQNIADTVARIFPGEA